MPPLPTAPAMAAWHTFLQAYARVIERLEAELQHERALPLSWYDVLVQLSQAPDNRLRMTELAGAVLLSKSGLTRLIDRMNAAGLVARSPDPEDRRGTFVELTPGGLERLRDAAPVHLRGVEEHFGAYLSDADARHLATALAKVVEGLARSRRHPPSAL